MRDKYRDIHEDDGMRHSGLIPSREERYQSKLEDENKALKEENKRLRNAINEAHKILGLAGERSFKKVSLAADQAFSVLGEFVEES